ncbi:MAG TPA: RDD family protein [Phycisphaerae bacterium]|nr:RDD family protein [Phycisphaerae bacterium]
MSGQRVNRLIIQTPEGCRFALLLAGPVTRFLAWLVDLLLVIGMTILAVMLVSMLATVSLNLALAVFFLLTFAIWFGYGIVLEWFWRGRTVGKRMLGLRVMDERGLRLTFPQVAIRNLLRIADMLPMLYLVGGIVCLLTRRCQRLGDLAAGTVVVRTPRLPRPDLAKVLGDKYNSFRAHPHLEARLRQRVGPEEARVALLALIRRDTLEAQARVELFAGIADHFRGVLAFPTEATEGLSDEQYVRNVVDTLFRPQRKG